MSNSVSILLLSLCTIKIAYRKNFFFSSFGQMIRPIIDSMSVRPSGGTPVSASASIPKGTKSVFEPRPTAEATSGWLVQCSTVVHVIRHCIMRDKLIIFQSVTH